MPSAATSKSNPKRGAFVCPPANSAADAAYFHAIDSMVKEAKAAGMKRDQLEALLKRGIVLGKRQMEASAAARRADREGQPFCIGYGGARGGGKSHWLIAQMAIDDCQRYPGLKCLLLRKSGKAIREQFRDMLKILKKTPHVFIASQGMGTLIFPNGSTIILGHFKDDKDIDGYLGLEYDVIGVEEATTLSKSKVDDILTCLRSSKPNWRPRAYFTTNPGNIGHQWFKKMFVLPARAGRAAELAAGTIFIPATVDDNAHVNREYKRQLSRLSGWKKKAWLFGDWDIAAGQFFTTWKQNLHVRDRATQGDIEIQDSWRIWLALDYGFTHWTMVYLFAEDGDGNVYVLDEHGARGWLPERHVEAVKAMLARHNIEEWRVERFFAGHDCWSKNNEGTTTAEKYEALGFELSRADVDRINGAAEILVRLGDFEATPKPIPNRVIISSRCVKLIECLPALQHDPACPERVKKWDADEDGEGGDDPYDAFRYGIMGASRKAGEAWNF
jgi:phage terminase large subunit